MEKDSVVTEWYEYVRELCNDDQITVRGKKEGSLILMDEVRSALRRTKIGKAAGPHNITTEMIKAWKILELEKSQNC